MSTMRKLDEFIQCKEAKENATELNNYGFPVLKRDKKSHGRLTSEMVYEMQDLDSAIAPV